MSHPEINELVVRIEGPVLDHKGDVIVAGGQADLVFIVILDDEESSHAAVYLVAGQSVGVGMVPVGSGTVGHNEIIEVVLARLDRQPGVPVHVRRDVQAVPVHDGLGGYPVLETDANSLSLAYPDDGAEVPRQLRQRLSWAFHQLTLKAPDPGGLTVKQGNRVASGRQNEFDVGLTGPGHGDGARQHGQTADAGLFQEISSVHARSLLGSIVPYTGAGRHFSRKKRPMCLLLHQKAASGT